MRNDLVKLIAPNMKKQNGQSAVEFALVAPLFFLLVLGMIYGGLMFMDYFNYNNQARAIAREISLATPNRRAEIKRYYEGRISSFYEVTRNVYYDDTDVTVSFNFTMFENTLPKLFKVVDFPPRELSIEYTMKLENTTDE